MSVIDSINDYKPENTFLLPEQYEIIRDKVHNVPFPIDNEELASQLIYAEMIKREEVRIPREEYDGDPEDYIFDNKRYTGMYLLAPKGIYKVAYEKQKDKESRSEKRRSWAAIIISCLSLAVSLWVLYLEYFASN